MSALTVIISGGASGAERGALRAAIDLDLGYGGWQWWEDDVPEVYEVRMRSAITRAMQRRLNVQDSDATLFVMRPGSKEMKFIVDACRAMRKPAKTLVLRDRRTDALLAWISERNISVLNVVGDAGEDETRDALVWMLDQRAAPALHCYGCVGAGCKTEGCYNYGSDPVRQDTQTKQSGDACSSQRIVSDGANQSHYTCDTCGAKPGEAHPGSADDFSPNCVCPMCGAWATFTEGGTDA